MVREYPFQERQFSPRELFILSARGEPRFRAWKEYAFDRMVEDSLATVAYLSTVLDTKDARERHTIKDILRKIGSPSVPMLSQAVLEGNQRAQAEASWILGLIGDAGAFDALIALAGSDSWKLRSSALNSLGKLEALSPARQARLAERVRQALEDQGEIFYVKKDAAYAAGKQNLRSVIPLLVASLKHDHYAVRYSSSEALRQLSETCGDAVSETLLAELPGHSPRAMVAAVYAAYDLSVERKLTVAQAVLDLEQSKNRHVALALARLIKKVEPETPDQQMLVNAVRGNLPQDLWTVEAILRKE
jgi:HEAT repeat protein